LKQEENEKEREIECLYKDFLNSIDNEMVLPSKIMKIDIKLDGKLSLIVKYSNSDIRVEDYEDFKRSFPQVVLEFFESRIVFPFDNPGTRKFHSKFNSFVSSSHCSKSLNMEFKDVSKDLCKDKNRF
jgi:hypothetical protein